MVQRLAIIGFVIAVIVAILAFLQSQQAVQQALTAGTAQALAVIQQETAVREAGIAAAMQAEAEAGQAEANQRADDAATAQADAQSTAVAAEAQVALANTAQAVGAATSAAQVSGVIATSTAAAVGVEREFNRIERDLATAQAQIEANATDEAAFQERLATATAQVDLANFAALAAEQDRATALANERRAATQVAALENQLATAQFQLTGLPPAPTPLPASSTPPPTLTPELAGTLEIITPTVVPQPTVDTDLSATFTSRNGVISFNYPQGWLAGQSESGFIAIASSAEVLQRTQSALVSGQFQADVYVLSGMALTGAESGTTVADVAQVIMDTLAGEDGVFTLGDIMEFELGGRPAARMDGEVLDNDALVLVLGMDDDAYVLMIATMAAGEREEFVSLALSMMESFQFNP
jgi:hypothetical protein